MTVVHSKSSRISPYSFPVSLISQNLKELGYDLIFIADFYFTSPDLNCCMLLDLEILAVVHHFTLELLNWTLKNEELETELSKLIKFAILKPKTVE